ncbi:MAG: type II toxin-antitoxin system HicA family toxin [Alphaproteobacteria bacterium]|nr:type II toxin-antitoxin system HicA family toxin [Alphaproteobacteria bacterium]
MTKIDKLLARMRQNPAGDWTIQDIKRLCNGIGWECLPPSGGGSHWKVTAPGEDAILTVPAKRPVKAVYIRKLLAMLERTNHGEAD